MAAPRELVAVVMDVGTSMMSTTTAPTPHEIAVKSVHLLVQQKILFSKKDELGLVLFGTQGTRNTLHDNYGGYVHVTVASVLDGLVVAMDMLYHAAGTKKVQKNVFLLTDAGSPCKTQDLEKITQSFNETKTKLTVFGVNFADASDPGSVNHPHRSRTKEGNEGLIRRLCNDTDGRLLSIHEAIDLLCEFRARSVNQVTKFRGPLEIGSLVINVWSYAKTAEQKFPTMKKLSAVSQQDDEASMGVRMERSYFCVADPDTDVPPDERVKGFKFGKQIVPITSVDEAAMKFEAEKGIIVLGFLPMSSVHQHYSMSTTDCLIAQPGDDVAAVALSSLIHALLETNQVALVRCVKRNRTSPALGICWPHVKANMECLYYSNIPFHEDVRPYVFSSFSCKTAFTPTKNQLAAAGQLIENLDLMQAETSQDGDSMEALKPKWTFNPVLQRFYQCVQSRALDPNGPLPPLDPLIARYVHPPEALFRRAEPALRAFKDAFPLTKAAPKEKTKRRYWKDSLDVDPFLTGAVEKRTKVSDEKLAGDIRIADLATKRVVTISTVDPVKDFQEMTSRRDEDMILPAVEQMIRVIFELVDRSVLDRFYAKAFDCIQALRIVCVREEEPELYNTFLHNLRSTYEGGRKTGFWELVRTHADASLITHEETEESDVTPEHAQKFFSAPVAAQGEEKKAENEEEEEDLFAMAD